MLLGLIALKNNDIETFERLTFLNEEEIDKLEMMKGKPAKFRDEVIEDIYAQRLDRMLANSTDSVKRVTGEIETLIESINNIPTYNDLPYLVKVLIEKSSGRSFEERAHEVFHTNFRISVLNEQLMRLHPDNLKLKNEIDIDVIRHLKMGVEKKLEYLHDFALVDLPEEDFDSLSMLKMNIERLTGGSMSPYVEVLKVVLLHIDADKFNQRKLKLIENYSEDEYFNYQIEKYQYRRMRVMVRVISESLEQLHKFIGIMRIG